MMVDDILQLAHNQQFLDRITNGKSEGGNLDLLKKLPKYDDLKDFERVLQETNQLDFAKMFHEPVGNYLFRTYLASEHSVDKAVFISDVELFKRLNDPSARQRVSEKIYDQFCAAESEDHIAGISVFAKEDEEIPWYASTRKSTLRSHTPTRSSEAHGLRGPYASGSPRRMIGTNGQGAIPIPDDETEDPHSTMHPIPQHPNNTPATFTSTNTVGTLSMGSALTAPHNHLGDGMDLLSPNNTAPPNTELQLLTEGTNCIGTYGRPIVRLKERINCGDTDTPLLFDGVLQEVLDDLRLDVFPRFCESHHFKMYIRCKYLESKTVSIKDFIALRPLGRGAFGLVHACEKRDCGKLYAMKQINKRRVQATDSIKTIMQERDYLAMMESKFVTTLKYALCDHDTLYLIIDLMLGGDMKYHLNTAERFPEVRTRFHAAEVLLGLEHLHTKSIVYRDLKLENILMDEGGHCKISDLGLAVKVDPNKNPTVRGYAGTPGYTAPEVVLGFHYDHIADFFSFGVMIYRCLCGKKPFQRRRDRRRQHKDNNRKSSQLDRNVIEMEPEFSHQYFTHSARSLLKGLMCKNPKRRLGANGINEIKQHPWFDPIDFGLLEAGYLQPSFVPRLREVHSPVSGTEAPPQDRQYADVKITEAFESQLQRFVFTSSTAMQDELVEVLRRSDVEKQKQANIDGKGGGINEFPITAERSTNSCLKLCQIM